MSHYLEVLRKENAPRLESLADDIRARKDPDFFWPTGTQVYVGQQGSGKTISAVKHVLDLKERYPNAVLISNLHLNRLRPARFRTAEGLQRVRSMMDPRKHYILFETAEQLAQALVGVNNDKRGVIYLIDEIHSYFNALDSKNIPPYIFTEISQQRKQRKLIIGTSQLFLRMAKPLREQCDNIVVCKTYLGFFTKQTAYDGMTLQQDYDGSLIGNAKKTGWFFHSRDLRNVFDTYQKIISSQVQLEELAPPEKSKKVKLFRK